MAGIGDGNKVSKDWSFRAGPWPVFEMPDNETVALANYSKVPKFIQNGGLVLGFSRLVDSTNAEHLAGVPCQAWPYVDTLVKCGHKIDEGGRENKS
jgi:hypothetical protein